MTESLVIEQVILMVDSKGYEADPVILTININIVQPEEEEEDDGEEEEEDQVIQ